MLRTNSLAVAPCNQLPSKHLVNLLCLKCVFVAARSRCNRTSCFICDRKPLEALHTAKRRFRMQTEDLMYKDFAEWNAGISAIKGMLKFEVRFVWVSTATFKTVYIE